ncbi:lipocalin-like domain-containing protein [Olleya aquimaris]|uniref:Lipocalin-like protein n=1 Tax=Olleya aquimaris TaxID=639310 RepID=A0A327R973_9FLAO|nr:lipocalin family protein [Olleya aquimaris]RAJ12164.1 lipocalin-like protein [Olleya aquimaris]
MKKYIQFCLIVITLILSSCDPDDGNQVTPPQASILGEWKLQSITYGTISEPLDDCELMQTFTFTANGNLDVYYDTSGNCDFATRTIFYVLENNILTVTVPEEGGNGSDYIIKNNIETLNQTTLVFIEYWDSIDGEYPQEDRVAYTYTKIN